MTNANDSRSLGSGFRLIWAQRPSQPQKLQITPLVVKIEPNGIASRSKLTHPEPPSITEL
jgi:hypothetical protein